MTTFIMPKLYNVGDISEPAAKAENFREKAKERQKRKPADSVRANLREQNEKAANAAGKALGVSGRNSAPSDAP